MPPTSPTIFPSDASYPFNKTNTDIILRSSDHVDFRVYSQILTAASPFFEVMFGVPQPPLEEQNLRHGLSVIEFSEDSATLDALLRVCYPIIKAKAPPTLETIETVLRAAMKYEIELAIEGFTDDLLSLAYEHPVPVWAIACRLELEDVARHAAQFLSDAFHPGEEASSFDDIFRTSPDTFTGVTAAQYFRLLQFMQDPDPSDLYTLLSPSAVDANSVPTSRHYEPFPLVHPEDMPATDITCLSSDGAVVRAHQAVLSAASSVLRSRIAATSKPSTPLAIPKDPPLPSVQRASSEERPLSPILLCKEPIQVLTSVVRCCYPNYIIPRPSDLRELVTLISAADRYGIAIALPALLDHWSSTVNEQDALEAYFVAIQVGNVACAKVAATHLLKTVIEGRYVTDMESSPAIAYHNLLAYHRACRRIAQQRLIGLWNEFALSFVPPSNLKRPALPDLTVLTGSCSWLGRYNSDIESIVEPRPHFSRLPTLRDVLEASIETEADPWCSTCKELVRGTLMLGDGYGELAKEIMEIEITT
ncbi:hypothetical protein C8Q78DRAFT_348081 [Trametes maxima]|nr:hypothetical protein C8Q78DRAFT_348081 [Trametes maxima]